MPWLLASAGHQQPWSWIWNGEVPGLSWMRVNLDNHSPLETCRSSGPDWNRGGGGLANETFAGYAGLTSICDNYIGSRCWQLTWKTCSFDIFAGPLTCMAFKVLQTLLNLSSIMMIRLFIKLVKYCILCIVQAGSQLHWCLDTKLTVPAAAICIEIEHVEGLRYIESIHPLNK